MSEAEIRGEALLAANAAFYRAFEQLDATAMRDVWLDDERIICIHPGWPVCRGMEDVIGSWRRIFEHTPYIEFSIAVYDHGVSGDRGWVVCEEGILQSHSTGLTRSRVLATNMYTYTDDQWRMVLHHGSPVSVVPEPESE